MWQRGPGGTGSSGVDWQGARAYCEGLATMKFAGVRGWRLPTAKELQTIIDDDKTAAPIIRDGISWPPGGSQHWSSTPSARDPSQAFVLVGAGTEYLGAVTTNAAYLNARCVRSISEP